MYIWVKRKKNLKTLLNSKSDTIIKNVDINKCSLCSKSVKEELMLNYKKKKVFNFILWFKKVKFFLIFKDKLEIWVRKKKLLINISFMYNYYFDIKLLNNGEKEIDNEVLIATIKTAGKELITTHIYKDDVYICKNDINSDLSVFETIEQFKEKSLEFIDQDEVKDILNLNQTNLKKEIIFEELYTKILNKEKIEIFKLLFEQTTKQIEKWWLNIIYTLYIFENYKLFIIELSYYSYYYLTKKKDTRIYQYELGSYILYNSYNKFLSYNKLNNKNYEFEKFIFKFYYENFLEKKKYRLFKLNKKDDNMKILDLINYLLLYCGSYFLEMFQLWVCEYVFIKEEYIIKLGDITYEKYFLKFKKYKELLLDYIFYFDKKIKNLEYSIYPGNYQNLLINYKTNFFIALDNFWSGLQILVMLFRLWDYCNHVYFIKNNLVGKMVDSYIDYLKIIVDSFIEYFNDKNNLEGLIGNKYYKKYKRLNFDLDKYEGKVINYKFEKDNLEDGIVMCTGSIKRLELNILNNCVDKKKIKKLEKELNLEKKYLNKYKIKLEKIEKLYFKCYNKWEDLKIQMWNFEKIINISNLLILKESFRKIFILYLQGNVTKELYDNFDKKQVFSNIKIDWMFLRKMEKQKLMSKLYGLTLVGCFRYFRINWGKMGFPSLYKDIAFYQKIVQEDQQKENNFEVDLIYESLYDFDNEEINITLNNMDTDIDYESIDTNLTIFGLFYKFYTNFFYNNLNKIEIDKGFDSLKYLVNLYLKYDKVFYVCFGLNGLLPIVLDDNGFILKDCYLYYLKVSSFGVKEKIRYQAKFTKKEDMLLYKKWVTANNLFLDKNKNFIELKELKNKKVKVKKYSLGFNYYLVKTKCDKKKELNAIIAMIVQSFDGLIVLNLIQLCSQKNIKFYYIFDYFLINEADYYIFTDFYKQTLKNVFNNSSQIEDYIMSVYLHIEKFLLEKEKINFLNLYKELINNLMYDKKYWDDNIWLLIKNSIYIITF